MRSPHFHLVGRATLYTTHALTAQSSRPTPSNQQPQEIYIFTEILIAQFLEIEPRPAMLWLGASTYAQRTPVPTPDYRTEDAVRLHLPILQRHGVPLLSAADALGPYDTDDELAWIMNHWRSDMQTCVCPPSVLWRRSLPSAPHLQPSDPPSPAWLAAALVRVQAALPVPWA